MSDRIYTMEFVAEDELPEGHNWVIVRQPRTDSEPARKWLFIRPDMPSAWTEARQAIRQIHGR